MKKKTLVKNDFVSPIRRPRLLNETIPREAVWRPVLESMSREELVNAAVSAAWEIEALNREVDQLWTVHRKNEEARRNGSTARLAKDEKAAVKAQVKELWLQWQRAGTPARGDRKKWARGIWNEFTIIEDFRTIERWITEFGREATKNARAAEPVAAHLVQLEARWEARPEIHKLLRFYPSGFFKLPVV
ncbi:MAG: hypothetical protein ACREO7_09345 [Pseudoxanthomonas sp.]